MADKYFTYGNDNVNQLLTTTLSTTIAQTPVDQVFKKKPFLEKMMKKAVRKDGGASILIPVMYAKNNTAQSYSGYDTLDTTPQDGFTSTQAKWKNVAVSIAISGEEERQNSGASKIVSLLDIKRSQAEESLKDLVVTQMFAAATGSKDIQGIPTLIDATSTIQDVNSTNNSWWQATVTSSGSFATQGLSDMRTTESTLSEFKPSSMLDIGLTTKTILNYYEAALFPGTRYTPASTVDGSFTGLQFRGLTLFSDPEATSGVIYMFSTDDLFFVINSNADFTATPFVKPAAQDARVAQIIFMAQLVSRARRKTGKITGIFA